MVFDPHVHFRDFKEKRKETIEHGLIVARDSGVYAVGDMPNSDPAILERDIVVERFKLADEANVPEVIYGLHMGLTEDPEQNKRAVAVWREFYPRVLGFKMYAAHSTNRTGIIRVDSQYRVIETLAKEGFDGVLAVHAEKESRMHHEIFTSDSPESHCFARPEITETEAIRDIIGFGYLADFKGNIHFVHVSTSLGVEYINRAQQRGQRITSGVCPHHLYKDWTNMLGKDGLVCKMNPALREPGEPQRLVEALRDGRIDVLETDHAPHSYDDKYIRCASGVVAEPWWALFKEFLRHNDFSEKRIKEVTLDNSSKIWGVDVKIPRNPVLRDHRQDYETNPWKDMEELLGMVNNL